MTTNGLPPSLPRRLRQAILLGLVLVTMCITAFGVTLSVDELSWAARPDNSTLAGSLAMVALGAPSFGVLLTMAVRELEQDQSMLRQPPWPVHTAAAASMALIGSLVGAMGIVADAIELTAFDPWDVAVLATWGSIGILYWRYLIPRFPPAGDLHVAFPSIIALVALGVGQIGLLQVVFDRLLHSLTDVDVGDARADSATWGAVFIVAAFAWIGIWLRRYESAPRTGAWHIVSVLIGAALGFTLWLTAVARLGWLVSVWVVGDRLGRSALSHFGSAPGWLAVGLTGGISFLYHRNLLGEVPERNDPIRVAEHLILFASIAASVIGVIVLASGVFDPSGVEINTTLAGIVTLLAGGSVVARLLTAMAARGRTPAGAEERASSVRRAYFLGVFAVGTVVALFAGIDALTGIFEDLLDGDATTRTFTSRRGQLATVVTVVPTLWLHQLVRERTPDRTTRTAMAT